MNILIKKEKLVILPKKLEYFNRKKDLEKGYYLRKELFKELKKFEQEGFQYEQIGTIKGAA